MAPSEPLTFWWTTLQKQKRNPTTTSFIAFLITGCLRKSSPLFPPDTTLPVPFDKDNTHLLNQPSDIHVCIYQERFGYMISIPSAHKSPFSVLRMVPTSVPMDQENFHYIDVGNSIWCLYCV
jgi:hypothetical protein